MYPICGAEGGRSAGFGEDTQTGATKGEGPPSACAILWLQNGRKRAQRPQHRRAWPARGTRNRRRGNGAAGARQGGLAASAGSRRAGGRAHSYFAARRASGPWGAMPFSRLAGQNPDGRPTAAGPARRVRRPGAAWGRAGGRKPQARPSRISPGPRRPRAPSSCHQPHPSVLGAMRGRWARREPGARRDPRAAEAPTRTSSARRQSRRRAPLGPGGRSPVGAR